MINFHEVVGAQRMRTGWAGGRAGAKWWRQLWGRARAAGKSRYGGGGLLKIHLFIVSTAMARGLSRELSKEKADKKKAGSHA